MNYIIVDVERNSFNYATDKPSEIVEIGAVKINDDGNIIDTFSTLVKPSCPLSKFTIKLTHITEEMISEAPAFEEAYKKFVQFLGDSYVFVSWGKEDYRFFQSDCQLFGQDLFQPDRLLDIQEVYMYGVLKAFSTPSLSSALEYLDIEENEHSHRALSDAESTAKIFSRLNSLLDIHSVQKPKRFAQELYFLNGTINNSGKKKFSKLIKTVISKTGNLHISWQEFKSHPKWMEYKDDFSVDNVLEKFYEKQFPKFKTNVINNLMQKTNAVKTV
ncbi:exonuclease domain-containing protein [Bacillus sp. M6-12]|uniref:exonuclease domain-containing protein n=1 Tax=Bacillus sp. M6-12 TaxID=2054166 RepID=UPI0015E0F716|nr:exonuclease domain-containing protein [Bacillus sp. M6-12]